MFRAIKIGFVVGLIMISGLFVASVVINEHWMEKAVPQPDKYAFRDTLLAPVSSARLVALSSGSFVETGVGHHVGIDLEGSKGLTIRAAAEGFVTFSNTGHGDDARIVLYHTSVKGVMETEYVGRFSFNVKAGDFVGRGQTIAEVPIDVEPRVHFAVYDHQGSKTDPCQFIPACRNITISDEPAVPQAHAKR